MEVQYEGLSEKCDFLESLKREGFPLERSSRELYELGVLEGGYDRLEDTGLLKPLVSLYEG